MTQYCVSFTASGIIDFEPDLTSETEEFTQVVHYFWDNFDKAQIEGDEIYSIMKAKNENEDFKPLDY